MVKPWVAFLLIMSLGSWAFTQQLKPAMGDKYRSLYETTNGANRIPAAVDCVTSNIVNKLNSGEETGPGLVTQAKRFGNLGLIEPDPTAVDGAQMWLRKGQALELKWFANGIKDNDSGSSRATSGDSPKVIHMDAFGAQLAPRSELKPVNYFKGIRNMPLNEFAQVRREIAEPYLKALAIIEQSGAPAQFEYPPAGGTVYRGDENSSETVAARENAFFQMQRREELRSSNALLFQKQVAINRLAVLFSIPPQSPDELAQLASAKGIGSKTVMELKSKAQDTSRIDLRGEQDAFMVRNAKLPQTK